MSMNIRYPNITGATEKEQLAQMKNFLWKLVDQLNYEIQTESQTKTTATGGGADGKNGKDGKDGKDGKTPQKGVDYWTEADVKQVVDATTKEVLAQKSAILEASMPVGYIYTSMVETSPQTLFGFGTWERLKDTFLLASGDTYAAGTTGGEAKHTLTVNELPSHTHPLYAYAWSWGNNIADAVYIPNNNAVGGTTSGNNIYTIQSKWNTTKSTGSGTAHNNMPPYTTVYVWKRTA